MSIGRCLTRMNLNSCSKLSRCGPVDSSCYCFGAVLANYLFGRQGLLWQPCIPSVISSSLGSTRECGCQCSVSDLAALGCLIGGGQFLRSASSFVLQVCLSFQMTWRSLLPCTWFPACVNSPWPLALSTATAFSRGRLCIFSSASCVWLISCVFHSSLGQFTAAFLCLHWLHHRWWLCSFSRWPSLSWTECL